MKRPRGQRCSAEASREVDLKLAVLSTLLEPGETLTYREIAEIVGVTHMTIVKIERKALASARKKFRGEMAA